MNEGKSWCVHDAGFISLKGKMLLLFLKKAGPIWNLIWGV